MSSIETGGRCPRNEVKVTNFLRQSHTLGKIRLIRRLCFISRGASLMSWVLDHGLRPRAMPCEMKSRDSLLMKLYSLTSTPK